MVFQDIATGIAGGKNSLLDPQNKYIEKNLIFTTAPTFQSDYEANEVNADLKYSNKIVVLSGIVTEIQRGIGENYYISLRGGSNEFTPPQANMANGYRDFVAQLQKGNTVQLVCDGKTSMLIGSAMAKNCSPASEWIIATSQSFDNRIFNNSSRDKFANNITAFAIFLSGKLPKNNPCLINKSSECLAAISKIGGFSPEMQAEFKASQAQVT